MTNGSNERPTRRLLQSRIGPLVVELSASTITMRPPRTKRGGPAEVTVTAGGIYEQALLRRVAPIPKR